MKKIALPLLVLLFSAYAHSEDYYKCREANGRIRYTDRLCSTFGDEYFGTSKKKFPVTLEKQERMVDKVKAMNNASNISGASEPLENKSPELSQDKSIIIPERSFVQGIYNKVRSFFSFSKANDDSPVVEQPVVIGNQAKSIYKCQGKTRCTEMNSCEEARFYLTNCPNVQIDGDHDGIPCEQQWCY